MHDARCLQREGEFKDPEEDQEDNLRFYTAAFQNAYSSSSGPLDTQATYVYPILGRGKTNFHYN